MSFLIERRYYVLILVSRSEEMLEGNDKDIYERLGVMDEKVNNHNRRIQTLEEDTRSLSRLTLLMEQQVEINKTQSRTLDKVNTNLTNLNNRFDNVEFRVENLESVNETRVSAQKETKKSLRDKVLYPILLAIIFGLLGYIGINL